MSFASKALARGLVVIAGFGACGGSDANPTPADAPAIDAFRVVSTTPADGATRVLSGTSVTLRFSDAVSPTTLNGASFTLADSRGAEVDGALSAANDGALFTPAQLLSPGDYAVALTSAVTSADGIALTPYSFSFTVRQDLERQVFTTSSTGTGDLSSWPEAGGAVGVAAGDAICQARAAAAGLDGTFVAWISDDTTDAYCHLLGLAGRRGSSCGAASFPAAGPWVRPDGSPFAKVRDIGATLQIFNPARYDEAGVRLSDAAFIFTGTDDNGAGTGECGGWASDDGTTPLASASATAVSWSSGARFGDCASENHLLCFETGTGPALEFPPPAGRVAFVTSTAGNGGFASWVDSGGEDGLAGADAICRARASAAALPNAARFEALLGDATTPIFSRLSSDDSLVRPDGSVIVESVADLGLGMLESTIHQDETGAYTGGQYVWTGHAQTETCGNWTGSGEGTVGRNWFADSSQFAAPSPYLCDLETAHLYCVEGAP